MVKRMLHCKRLVVKIGTSSLIHQNGKVNLQTIDRLAYTLTALTNQGYELVLVTSGAIGVGMAKLGVTLRPAEIAQQQALAAIGQSELMTLYTQRFSDYGAKIGQLLLTHDVFDYPQTRQHVLDTINALLKRQVMPIINENDSVAVDELDHRTTFGDNDQLSALVAKQIGADLLVVLSDIDGLYDRDPNRHANAALIETPVKAVPFSFKAVLCAFLLFNFVNLQFKLGFAGHSELSANVLISVSRYYDLMK